MDTPTKKRTIYVCTNLRMSGASCQSRGGKAVVSALKTRATDRHGENPPNIEIIENVCMGFCKDGPNVRIAGGAFYHGVAPADVDAILDDLEND